MLFDLAARNPDGVAVDDSVRARSFAELADRSVRFARFLREEAGLEPEDHLALLMENRVEYIELLLGAIMAGVWITPINWHLRRDEITYVLADSGARLLVTSDDYAAIAESAAEAAGVGTRLVRAGTELDALLDAASDEPMDPEGPAGGNHDLHERHDRATQGRGSGRDRRPWARPWPSWR